VTFAVLVRVRAKAALEEISNMQKTARRRKIVLNRTFKKPGARHLDVEDPGKTSIADRIISLQFGLIATKQFLA